MVGKLGVHLSVDFFQYDGQLEQIQVTGRTSY